MKPLGSGIEIGVNDSTGPGGAAGGFGERRADVGFRRALHGEPLSLPERRSGQDAPPGTRLADHIPLWGVRGPAPAPT
jgi:hypothetical protein